MRKGKEAAEIFFGFTCATKSGLDTMAAAARAAAASATTAGSAASAAAAGSAATAAAGLAATMVRRSGRGLSRVVGAMRWAEGRGGVVGTVAGVAGISVKWLEELTKKTLR